MSGDIPDLAALRGVRQASDAEYIEQLEQLSLGQERENALLRALVEGDEWRASFMKIMMTIDGGRSVWGDPLLGQVADAVAEMETERDRLRAGLEIIAIPPVHVPGVSEGCEGCAGVARAALDGTDFSSPVAISLEDAVTEHDRLRAVVDAAREFVAAQRAWIEKVKESGGVSSSDEESHRRAGSLATLGMQVDLLDTKEGT